MVAIRQKFIVLWIRAVMWGQWSDRFSGGAGRPGPHKWGLVVDFPSWVRVVLVCRSGPWHFEANWPGRGDGVRRTSGWI